MSGSQGASFKGAKPSEREGRHNPKFIGEIPGYPVGSRFMNRNELSGTGVHAPLRAGIHGAKVDGAYSVVLSYGYEDDEDYGETFIYTGQGGRVTDSSRIKQMQGKESWGNNHQASDQEWKLGNKALQISWLRGTPIRVIRGAPRKNAELYKYAPSEGLRYDGLYRITNAWKDEGATGFKTCKFLFERLPNQIPLPGGYPSSLNAATASSLKEFKELFRVGQSSDLTKSCIPSFSKPIKPPRTPFVPRPPYRPSKEEIEKLRAKSRSKSTSHSITPEYAGADPAKSKDKAGYGYGYGYGYHHREDSYISISGRDETVSPILGSSRFPYPPRDLNKLPKRPRYTSFSDVKSDEENVDDRLDDDDAARPWAAVRGKKKLPPSLTFKKTAKSVNVD